MAFKLGRADGVSQLSAGTFKIQASLSKSIPNSTLVVVGKLGGRCTQILVNTCSAVTLV